MLELPRGRSLELAGRPLVMGVVNLTPDSFSDGGLLASAEQAVAHGLSLLEQGADLLDLGAESTRPGGGVYGSGAREVPASEELDRLLPVLQGLRAKAEAVVSVDTRKGSVARAALEAGADLINDVSTLSDPELGAAVAEAGCPLVLMHSRGALATMQTEIHFDRLMAEIRGELADAVARAEALGIERQQLIVDPGIGFGKTYSQGCEILARLGELAPLGLPVLVGASRKSFIGHLTGGAPPQDRLAGSLAAAAWAVRQGAAIVRVHDVRDTVRFLKVWSAIEQLQGAGA
ncbi:MAG: dihydropteroate synthase [Thermoanaerobaculia bacterium]